MRNVKFTVEHSLEYGYTGIIPLIFRGWFNYTPSTAPGHDLLDHTTNERGEVWQELRALGANLFIHSFGKNLANGSSVMREGKLHETFMGESFSGESFQNILRDQQDEWTGESFEVEIPEAPKYKLNKKEKTQFKLFKHAFRNEIERTLELDYIDESTAEFFRENERGIFSWFEYGFANAKRRYRGESYQAAYMKEKINRLVSKAMNFLTDYEGTGEEFTLSYSIEDSFAEIRDRRGESLVMA